MADKGIDFETINYIDHPLSVEELSQLFEKAGLKPADALRHGEDAYRQFVAGKDLTDTQLIQIMAMHPELIQRPIVVRGQRAVLARPAGKLVDLDIQ